MAYHQLLFIPLHYKKLAKLLSYTLVVLSFINQFKYKVDKYIHIKMAT